MIRHGYLAAGLSLMALAAASPHTAETIEGAERYLPPEPRPMSNGADRARAREAAERMARDDKYADLPTGNGTMTRQRLRSKRG